MQKSACIFSCLYNASENITKWFSKWAFGDLIIAHFIDSKEKKTCRMTFKSCCITTDKMRAKQFTVTVKSQ